MLDTAITVEVPEIHVDLYPAPRIQITPATSVVSTTPIGKNGFAGSYQHIVLNTVTSELFFHEGTSHLEPPIPHDSAKAKAAHARWYPGKLWSDHGPHAWFEKVPEKLYWTLDNGGAWWPYVGVDEANDILSVIAPYAQELLDNLTIAGGELDWSATSVRAGRQIRRLCNRDRTVVAPDADTDLVDYGTLVRQYPQTYRPRLLDKELSQLLEECEYLTRFLGCNSGWHEEIKKTFGKLSDDGTYVYLDVLGIRAWYRTLLIGDDPRPMVEFAEWDQEHRSLENSPIRSTSTTEELDAWAAGQKSKAADTGVRLTGAMTAGCAYRSELWRRDAARLQQIGPELERARTRLAALEAEQGYLTNVAKLSGR